MKCPRCVTRIKRTRHGIFTIIFVARQNCSICVRFYYNIHKYCCTRTGKNVWNDFYTTILNRTNNTIIVFFLLISTWVGIHNDGYLLLLLEPYKLGWFGNFFFIEVLDSEWSKESIRFKMMCAFFSIFFSL